MDINFISAKHHQQELGKDALVMILIAREVLKEYVDQVLPEIGPVIKEFSNVFSEDLPNKLPPMRDIQHAIDLVLGASPPNLSRYRMNHIEYTALKGKLTIDEKRLREGKYESLCWPHITNARKDGTEPDSCMWTVMPLTWLWLNTLFQSSCWMACWAWCQVPQSSPK